MSCDTNGTPGDEYLSIPCSYDCETDGTSLCNLNGGMKVNLIDIIPGCKLPEKSCNCLDGFYSHYHTCLPLPNPSNCITTYISGSSSRAVFDVANWDGDTIYASL